MYTFVYTDAMERIRSQDQDHATLADEALAWVVRAKRPLRSLEFLHALAFKIDAEIVEFGDEDLHDIDLIISLSAGLIVEDKQSGTVRLVHYTAQNFFEETWREFIPTAEITIAIKCIKYLSLPPFMAGPCSNDDEMEKRLAGYPLLDYSAKHWALHVSASDADQLISAYAPVQDAILQFLRNTSLVHAATQVMEATSYRYHRYADNYARNTHALHLVA